MAMGDEELLNTYKARHGSKVDRLVIEEIAQLRIESGGAKAEKLNYKFSNLQAELMDQLPGDERAALEMVEQAAAASDYADRVSQELMIEADSLTGNPKLQDKIAIKRLATHNEKYEQEVAKA